MKLDLGVGGRERGGCVCLWVEYSANFLLHCLGESKKKHLMPGRYAAFVNQGGKKRKKKHNLAG